MCKTQLSYFPRSHQNSPSRMGESGRKKHLLIVTNYCEFRKGHVSLPLAAALNSKKSNLVYVTVCDKKSDERKNWRSTDIKNVYPNDFFAFFFIYIY